MGCNCGKRKNLGAVTPEVAAMEEANRKAQAAAEALIVAQADRIAAQAVAEDRAQAS